MMTTLERAERPAVTRRSLLGAAATAAVAGTALAKMVQRSGLDEYHARGGFGLVVAQHELRVDHGRLTDVAAEHREGTLAPFVAIGFSVPDDVEWSVLEQAMMRTRGADGWSAWNPVPFAPEEAPDGTEAAASRRLASQPYWVGFGDGFEVELPEGLAGRCAVHLVRETPFVVAHHDDSLPANVIFAPEPQIRPRSLWSARAPRVSPTYAPSLSMAVVHHTVDRNGYSVGEVPGMIAATQRYHMDVNGWNDIAYNFMIDRFGQIWEARSGGIRALPVGGHASGFNTGNTGICAIGDYHFLSGSYTRGVPPAPEMLTAYEALLAWKLGLHGIDPMTTVEYRAGAGSRSSRYPAGTIGTFPRVVGHTDVGATACPGSLLHPHLPAMRTAAAGRQLRFADVAPESAAAPAVAWMVEAGLLRPPGAGAFFRPGSRVSRETFVTWMWRMMGTPRGFPPHRFADVERNGSAGAAVRWAKAAGILGAGANATHFRPRRRVTRVQAASMLWRMTGRRTGYPPHGFADVPASASYRRAVRWFKGTGTTTLSGNLEPRRAVTRSDTAIYLHRLARNQSSWVPEVVTPPPPPMRF
jgi:hypothetical protein